MRWGALLAVLLSCSARGQECFHVYDAATGRPLTGALVGCVDGSTIATTDTAGLACPAAPCDPVVVSASGHEPARVGLVEALALGEVRLVPSATELPGVVVHDLAMQRDRTALATGSLVDSTLLAGAERASLRTAVQWTPGVQWDERGAGGSSRLSIRGSLARAPYGVRGVKAYWGPFPLTLADGSTPLEILDPDLIGSLQVVRSIGSPVNGSAPSGLLLAAPPFRSAHGQDAWLSASAGAYGFFRLSASARSTDDHTSLFAGVLRQRNDGYRSQEWTGRDQVMIGAKWRQKRGRTLALVTWQDASWALPGSIDSLTAIDAPRSPRPYSQAINAHIDKQQLLGGVSNELRLGPHWHCATGVSAQVIRKKNPYGTTPAASGYKEEDISGLTARLAMAGDARPAGLALNWEIGVEALHERDQLRENTYTYAVPGPLRTDADTRVDNLNAFAALDLHPAGGTTVHLDAGMERTAYEQTDHLTHQEPRIVPTAQAYPLVAIEQQVRPDLVAHARYATSVSRPTVWELLGTTGVFNATLQAERVTEWELGIQHRSDSARVALGVNAYRRRTATPITAVVTDSSTTYMNLGAIEQQGIELQLHGRSGPGPWPVDLLLFGTLQDARATWVDGSRHAVPGIPNGTFGSRVRLAHRGLLAEVGWRYFGEVKASSTLNDRVPGYQIAMVRVEYRWPGKAGTLTGFVQVENLLDASYTAFVQLDDPGRRYYNPAPGRSLYAGIGWALGASGPGANKDRR